MSDFRDKVKLRVEAIRGQIDPSFLDPLNLPDLAVTAAAFGAMYEVILGVLKTIAKPTDEESETDEDGHTWN